MTVRPLGPVGRLAGLFLHSRLTVLFIVASILLGFLGLGTLAREEEPQIQVPMVDIRLAWPGHPVEQVERQLTAGAEQLLWKIPGLEYLYSTSTADGSLLILRFKVGMSPDQALGRVRSRLDEITAQLPAGARIAEVSPRSIDDVPVLALTLTAPKRMDWDQNDLRRVAEELAQELRRTDGVSRVRVLGGEPRRVRIAPSPARMAVARVTVDGLLATLSSAGLSLPAGNVLQEGRMHELRAESPFTDVDGLRALAVPTAGGGTVRLSEIA